MPKTSIKARPKAEPVAKVKVHNRAAGRPLLFQLPGQSVRLGPGESEWVARDCLNAHELRSLCASGLLAVEEPAASSAEQRKRRRKPRRAPTAKKKQRPATDERSK